MIAVFANRLLTGPQLQPLQDACVLVEGETIAKIMTRQEFLTAGLAGCEVVELGDVTLMPGMIECHNHLALDARLPGHLEMMGESECLHTILALKGLQDDLLSGVTTARCLGDRNYMDVELKKQIRLGRVAGPDLLVSGIGMKSRHGHGYVGLPHSGAEELRRTARENMFRGVDVLKIFVTPGAPVGPGEFIPCFLTLEEIATVVEEAHNLNLPVAAHCIGGKGLDYCVKAGVDVIEHVYSITPEQVELVAKEHKGWIDLTSGIVLDPDREPYCAQSFVDNLHRVRDYSRQCMARVVQCPEIRWTLGTDANHGLLYREAEYACEMGATPLQALQGLTSAAAEMCRIQDKTGSLTPGLRADLIAVQGDPLENVSVLQNVSFVMKAGSVCKQC